MVDSIEAAKAEFRRRKAKGADLIDRCMPHAIEAYLRAEAEAMTRGQMTGRAQERAAFLADLAAEVERKGERDVED